MTYLFRSKATGDVLMLAPSGDQWLRIIGKEPAAKGIIEPAAMPAAIRAIEQAIAQDEALQAQAEAGAAGSVPNATGDDGAASSHAEEVSLRQRAWPLVEMMKSAHAAAKEIVWGV